MLNHQVQSVNRSTLGRPLEGGPTTVLKAFGVLDVLVAEPRGLGLSEAARRAGLNKATAFRLLGALQQAGVVSQDAAGGRYRPALKLVAMAEQVLSTLDLRGVAHPYVERVARESGHGVLVGVLDGAEVVYVDHVPGAHQLRVHRSIGGRRSVHVSSIGKAILAHLPEETATAVLTNCRFERRTAHTITSRQDFMVHLRDVRAQGWALVQDEDVAGASSVSAPVFDHTGGVVGAMGIAVPTSALQGAERERIVPLLLEATRSASAALGEPSIERDTRRER